MANQNVYSGGLFLVHCTAPHLNLLRWHIIKGKYKVLFFSCLGIYNKHFGNTELHTKIQIKNVEKYFKWAKEKYEKNVIRKLSVQQLEYVVGISTKQWKVNLIFTKKIQTDFSYYFICSCYNCFSKNLHISKIDMF